MQPETAKQSLRAFCGRTEPLQKKVMRILLMVLVIDRENRPLYFWRVSGRCSYQVWKCAPAAKEKASRNSPGGPAEEDYSPNSVKSIHRSS